MKDINILWFKKDLRIDDNEALYESLKDNDILPIYIFEIGFGIKTLIQEGNGNFVRRVYQI